MFYTSCTPLLLRVLASAVARVKQQSPKYMHSRARWEQLGWSRKVQERAVQSYEDPNPAGFSFLPASQGLKTSGVCLSTWAFRNPGWITAPVGLDWPSPGVLTNIYLQMCVKLLKILCWNRQGFPTRLQDPVNASLPEEKLRFVY